MNWETRCQLLLHLTLVLHRLPLPSVLRYSGVWPIKRGASTRATFYLVPSEDYVGVTDETGADTEQDANGMAMCFRHPVRHRAGLSPDPIHPQTLVGSEMQILECARQPDDAGRGKKGKKKQISK